jgi:DNA invertase Pin-like site-specific DNA recombinase
MTATILPSHRSRPAYVYLRQSTMAQVLHNTESTERQYAFQDKARQLGWAEPMIRVLDGDLGVSGAQTAGREDFKTLVADVSMGKVGAVFALEASRLARSCTDWHRLLELCALTGTLLIDEDGSYNPADFNDELLLGLKGTMSQAELHVIRARLQGGKLNKARKGQLKFPLPVGLCYDDQDATVLDPDQEVRGAVRLLFDSFRQTASAYGVVKLFADRNMTFPKRSYGGVWNGKLIWSRLTHGRVLGVIKNPSYAGTYVYGRYRYVRKIGPDGNIRTRMVAVPMSEWAVVLHDHHQAYIPWQEYLDNQARLEQNQTNGQETVLSGPAREGLALCQGLLLCGTCGRKLTVRYQGNGGLYPIYECNWRKREGIAMTSCMQFRCDLVDPVVAQRALEALDPTQIQIALASLDDLDHRNKAVQHQWRMKIQRAEYEAQLAQRRYEEVDPANRLVAATLEQRWDQALASLEQVKQAHAEYERTEVLTLTEQQKAGIVSLAQDLPRLWNAPTTQAKDRKRILRLLVKDITVERLPQRKLVLHVRWCGDDCEDISVALPQAISDRLRYPSDLVDKVRGLAVRQGDDDIAGLLNRQGLHSAKGKPFTPSMIKWIRYRHRIAAPVLKRPEELTVAQTAARFGVSPNVVYYWIERGMIRARKLNRGSPHWISIDPDKDAELREKVRQSTRIRVVSSEHPEGKL